MCYIISIIIGGSDFGTIVNLITVQVLKISTDIFLDRFSLR